jgi:alpha-ribazole phosphatase
MSADFWRHPKPIGYAGRCIGRTELQVDPRKAKRLAHRVRRHARQQGLPSVVITSPSERCAAVGRWLRRWGWTHCQDAALRELDFGAWDGLAWSQIRRTEIDAWCSAFADFAPGGGESLCQLLARVAAWRGPAAGAQVITHGGWMRARRWLAEAGQREPTAAEWAATPGYGVLERDRFG